MRGEIVFAPEWDRDPMRSRGAEARERDVHVLLIEDDPEDVMLVERCLRKPLGASRPFILEHTAALHEGLEHLGRGDTDGLLLDLNLPDSHGVDTVVRVRERDPEVPIVVFTTSGDDGTALRALEAGAQDYLVKSELNGSLLRRAIRCAIERQRTRRQNERRLARRLHTRELESLAALAGSAAGGLQRRLGGIVKRADVALGDLEWSSGVDPVRLGLLEIRKAAFDAAQLTRGMGTQVGDRSGDRVEGPVLEEARRHAQSIVDTLREPLLVLDADQRIVSANRAFYQIFQVAREQTEGRPIYELGCHQWDIPRLRELLTAIVSTGAHFEAFEVDHAFPTIGRKTMLLNARRLEQTSGGPPCILLAIEDISERRRAETALARQARELGRSNADLLEFASVAAHDLQEPLRKIQFFGQQLRTECGEALGAEGQDHLERMRDAAKRMQRLIRDLLALARIGSAERVFVPVDLAAVARGVLSDLEVQIATLGPTVQVGELPTIEADPLQMRQLLQNLIDNALKFHRSDEAPVVKIHGEVLGAPRGCRLESSPVGGSCRVTVEDNGIGFDEQYRDRIFNVLRRLHPRDQYEGTGIGLAICRKIVERHGGEIFARSTPGRGSTFVFTLPLVHAEEMNRDGPG